MNVQALTEAELRQKECTKDFETVTSLEKQDRLAEAQFYLAEIDRRHQAIDRRHSRWIEWRDLLLELLIIGLIGSEIRFARTEGDAQLGVLSKLQTSSEITAQTLKDVRKAQEATTSAIRPQVALLERTRGTLAAQPGPSGYLGYVARVLGDPRLHEIRVTFWFVTSVQRQY